MKTKTFEELSPKDKIYVCYSDGSNPGIADIKFCNDCDLGFRFISENYSIKRNSNFIAKSKFTAPFSIIFSDENKFKEYIRSKRVEKLNNMISKVEKEIEEIKQFRIKNWPLFSGDYYTKKIEELNIF